jgi:formyltetrahydrofolate deformylase
VHAVSGFLLERGGNIEEAAQYNDRDTGLFFMRVAFACELDIAALQQQIGLLAQSFGMRWSLHDATAPMRCVIMVSREGHCLNDLLFRCKSGLLPLDVRAIVSNHRDFYQLAASYNIPFHHIPVTAATKEQAEARQLEIIRAEQAELVVLARYMQVLSADFLTRFAQPVINIHHSFLPAFAGGRPYHQAHARGVKLIGATAHYATRDLDEGPIIHQEVIGVEHFHTPDDLRRLGRDCERLALARHVETTALELLHEYKPDQRLYTNVEYYAAAVLETIKLDPGLYTPTFAVSRTAGWTAHMLEQIQYPRLIRPQVDYVGPMPS